MIVTYIFHSCYVIELDGFSVVVDFYEDVPREDGSFWIKDYLLSKKQPLYVLCTHSHADHFNPEILRWKAENNAIEYIFSGEILESGKTKRDDAHYLNKLGVFEDERIKIQNFGSTDLGGSFLITVGGKAIFHAGDLNNWHWKEEVHKEEALVFENNYLCELELLAENIAHIYLTMFPIDPRLGKDYMLGAEQFLDRISSDYFLPMHFGEHYHKANAFGEYAEKNNCTYLPVYHKGQSYQL
ncbi:MAG: MBL fold metallo-hydrolase [Petrimonas sp.]|nr:MBL fold metallo-hydrolase [Petrimonas sp.]